MAESKTARTAAAKKPAADAPAAPVIDFANLQTEEVAALPRKSMKAKELPLLVHVEKALNDGKPARFPSVPAEAVKPIDNQLRACGRRLDCRVEVRPVDKGDGTWDVYYAASAQKAQRKYTVKEVRAWAQTQGIPDELLFPRVRKEVTTAYREAHNLPTRERR